MRKQNKHISTFGGGLNMDINKSLLKENQYRYAENVRLVTNGGSTTGAITNIEGSTIINGLTFDVDETILFTTTVRDFGVIFTKTLSSKNKIYRITFSGSDIVSCINVLSISGGVSLGLTTSSIISCTGRYEDDDNIKIYWADGVNPIRSINISSTNDIKNSLISEGSQLNIVPSSELNLPIIDSIGVGSLNSGIIQYAYQLYGPSGTETFLSPISKQLNITADNIENFSIDYNGSPIGETYGSAASKSVRLKIELPISGIFSRIKLISIYYYNYNKDPIITIVKDINIGSSDSIIYIEDNGVSVIGELTLSEFNLLSTNTFVPNYIEAKDDILFAANIKEDLFDVLDTIYDTRSYQFNSNAHTLLHSVSGTSVDYEFANINTIPITADAIHEEIYSTDRYANIVYKYNSDGKFGGTGLNVSYLFTNTYLIESYGDYWAEESGHSPGLTVPASETNRYIDQRTPRIGDIKRTITALNIRNSDGTDNTLSLSSIGLPTTHVGPLNYANPYLANAIKSYQRDEIYRFAAVFYDRQDRKSTAHWIADIRFPAGYMKNSSWSSSIFEMPNEVDFYGYDSNSILSKQELLVKPLGISFTFDNLDLIPEVGKIEIVRAKRDINNKTILAQGAVQKVGTYRPEYGGATSTVVKINSGLENTLRPHSIMSMGDSYSIATPYAAGASIGMSDYLLDTHYNSDPSATHDVSYILNGLLYENSELAPAFYNKDFLLFVNPETSYYGIDFTSQLKNISNTPDLDIVDVIFPISTPTKSLTQITVGGVSNYSYYGSIEHDRLDGGMYMSADIVNRDAYNIDKVPSINGVFITNGYSEHSSGTHKTNSSIQTQSNFDIYRPEAASFTFTEPYKRTFISFGGFFDNMDNNDYDNYEGFNNGMRGTYYNQLSASLPIVQSPSYCDLDRNTTIFKFFCRFDYRDYVVENGVEIGDTVGGLLLSMVYRNSNSLLDTTEFTCLNLMNSTSTHFCHSVSSIEYSGVIMPGVKIENVPTSSYIPINNSLYLNWTKPLSKGDGYYNTGFYSNGLAKSRSNGTHGAGIILGFDSDAIIPSITGMNYDRKRYKDNTVPAEFEIRDNVISAGTVTYVTNLKKMSPTIYGGNSRVDRQLTEYISTGYLMEIAVTDTTSKEIVVFGGDIFIGIFDYTITHATDPMQVEESEHSNILRHQTKYIGALIPLESSINMHLVNSESFIAQKSFAIQERPGYYQPGLTSGNIWSFTQTIKQFDYNAAYSSENIVLGSFSKLINSETGNVFDCRVKNSSKKTNDETYDSWSKFKESEYIDVDTKYGQITGLYKFDNKLFFFQKDAFGLLSINERSIIKDNNISNLALGVSGSVLSRFDYISTSNGFSYGIIGGITDSGTSIYWYDHARAEMCIFNRSVESISKAKGIQTILNLSKSDIIAAGNKIPMIYDKKYNEIISTIYGIKDASTLI